jgi:hypothetical protein
LKTKKIEFFHNGDHTFCVVALKKSKPKKDAVGFVSLYINGMLVSGSPIPPKKQGSETVRLTGHTVKHPKDKYDVDVANKHALEDAVRSLPKTDRAAVWTWFLHHPVSDNYQELPFEDTL